MKKIIFLFVLLSSTAGLFAQTTDSVKVYRVGIFANLFLDSSFTGKNYKFANQMPKHILPGLDFVQGALMAVDSLTTKEKLQVQVYDLRSANQSITALKNNNSFDSLDLMIGAVSGNEYRMMAEIARVKNIPFVSATLPNDGGVTNNPYTVIVNSTLPVHCEAIYNFIMRTNPTANILYVRKRGVQEDRLQTYFDQYNKGTNGNQVLKWKTISLTDSFTVADLHNSLDSERVNLVLCASLDEQFGLRIAVAMNNVRKKYPVELIGMPTWDAVKELAKPEFNELPVYYSTTFHSTGTAKWTSFTKSFTDITHGRPSDLAYRGYELSWHFIGLLLKYNNKLMQNLNDRSFRSFTEFDFKPILNNTTGMPDYYENKRIYILKRTSGLILRMN